MSGRHRRGWLSGLVTAVKRYYGFGVPQRVAYTLDVVRGEAVVALPVRRCPSDDWYADPPTVELPVVRPQRMGAKEALSVRRERYWNETPLFMAVMESLGINDFLGVAA